jgi:23S rRNA (guanosine2251-2'-O)-methyltransferase
MAHQQRKLDAPAGPTRELLYGRHAVLETLRAGRRRVHRVYVSPGVRGSEILSAVETAAQDRGCPVDEASPRLLEVLGAVNHQGVMAEAGLYPYLALDDLLSGDVAGAFSPLYLALDHVQDVQNLGTLLRTAEAMAVAGVIMPERRAAGITPAVVNSSAGAVEHLRIALMGNLAQALERLKRANVWVAGLDNGPSATPLHEADLTGPLAFVVGAEGAGLARLIRERCDWLVGIPMYGQVESLNAAVAGSLALVAARQAQEKFARLRAGI